jgi:ribosomal protein L34E
MQQLPTTCKTCGKKLNVVEIFFNNGLCDKHEASHKHQGKAYCDTCGTPLQGKQAHFIDGLYYCSEHIPH